MMEDVELSTRSANNPKEKEDKKLMATTATSPAMPRKKRRSRCICLWVTAVLLGLGLLFLILGLTVFKAKKPVTKVDSLALSDLDFSLDIARLRVILNVSLAVGLSVENPNRVGFRYTDSTAILRYRENDVGEVPVPAGRIGAGETRTMNVTLTIMADRLLSNSNLLSDALSGTMPFQTYIKIAGKVRILFDIHVVTYTTCDLEIDLGNRTLANQSCHYRTKL